MSSAILYLAIIAIWACVLIPRWLRRDSARGASPAVAVSRDVVQDEDPSSESVPAESVPAESVPAESVPAESVPGESVPGESVPGESVSGDVMPAEANERVASDSPSDGSPPPPLTREESRQRMMTARRRLLGMLLALEIGAIALALMGLAALWVVIPPTVMFGGYLLLLREAAHADAEHARREQEAAWARARARERARARAEAGRGDEAALVAPVAPAGPAGPVAGFEGSGPGRDFAPGLAGKYTTSNAEALSHSEPASEDFYDQYTQNRLRAVGD